jgi:hypothetical protein
LHFDDQRANCDPVAIGGIADIARTPQIGHS